MTLIARPATARLGFDCSQKPTEVQARACWTAGYRWAARYTPLPGVGAANDIEADELVMLCEIGFEVSLIQHVRYPGWDPGEHNGHADGALTSHWARLAGFPQGAHLYVDLEGMTGSLMAAKDYAEAWAKAALEDGYLAGVYVGYSIPLNSEQLWLLHGVNTYWSDFAHRKVENRGCAVNQGPAKRFALLEIDEDVLAPDLLDEVPMVAALVVDEVA